jgi:uncharacterized membrane protein YqjE
MQAGSANRPRESFGELLSQLAKNSAALIRDEVELAKREMQEKLAATRAGIIIIATGVAIAFAGLLGLCAAAIIWLARYIGFGWSSLVVGSALAIIGAATAIAGVKHIRRTGLKPEQTIQTLQEDKEWLKELT